MIGAGYGFLGVALGAFGAHVLKTRLSADLLATLEIGVRYQMLHACALLAAAWAHTRWPGRASVAAGCLLATGTAIFCGSLYALSLTGARALGAVTPFGGLALLAGWMCLAWTAWSGRS